MKLNQIALISGAVLVAFSAGRFSSPKKVEVKEVEKVVYKDRIVKDKTRDVSTRTKETRLPDGTKIKETIKDERSTTHTDKNRELAKETQKEVKTENRANYRISVVYHPALPGFQGESYGAIAERRLFSEVYMGVMASTDSRVGIVLSFGF